MPSDVEIANASLTKLGHNSIQSFLDDSDEARAVNAVYSFCRDDVQAAHPWNFATVRSQFAKLAEDPSTVTDEFSNVYALPTDTLRVLWIEPKSWRFVVENGKLYTNVGEPLKGAIIKRITDAGSFSTPFTICMVYRLAAELCNALTARSGTSRDFYASYLQKLQEAKSTDGMESSPEPEDLNPLADARMGGVAGSVGIYYDGFYAR